MVISPLLRIGEHERANYDVSLARNSCSRDTRRAQKWNVLIDLLYA